MTQSNGMDSCSPNRHQSATLVSVINQQGLDVDFGKHGLLVDLLRVVEMGVFTAGESAGTNIPNFPRLRR